MALVLQALLNFSFQSYGAAVPVDGRLVGSFRSWGSWTDFVWLTGYGLIWTQ